MNKKIFSIFLGILISAACPLGLISASYLGNYGKDVNLKDMIPGIETATWVIFGGIAVVCFVIAGVTFLTSEGQPEKLKTARSAFFWGVVGVIVGIIAYSILNIIQGIL